MHGGFISITDDSAKILSDLAELAEGIDVNRAQAAVERAEAVVARGDDEVAVAEAISVVARANARLRVRRRPRLTLALRPPFPQKSARDAPFGVDSRADLGWICR